MAQTIDGFLWLGTSDGLYRFDGATFERFEPRSWSAFPILDVRSLFAVPSGDLWIGFGSGVVSVLRNGEVTNYTASDGVPAGLVLSFAQDREGAMWASTTEGLARLEGNRWKEVGKDWNFPGKVGCGLFVDRQGTLWVAADNTIFFLPARTRQFQPTAAHIGQLWQFSEAPNGKLWIAETSRAVRPAPLNTGQEPPDNTEIILGSVAVLFDRDGALWITTLGDGMRRAPAPQKLRGRMEKSSAALETFTSKDGLSDDYTNAILQDREGNIWVGTHKGLDRFRKTTIIPVALPFSPMQAVLAAGDNGDVWGSSVAGLAHIHLGRAYALPLAMFPDGIHISYRSPDGIIWWLGQNDVYRSEKGRFSRFPLPKELPRPFNGSLQVAEDRSHRLWLAAAHNGLFRLKNSEWTKFDAGPDIEKLVPIVSFADSEGRVWFSYAGGAIAIFNGDTIERVFSAQQSTVGNVRTIDGDNGHIWVGGDRGLAVFLGDHFQQVAPADARHFQTVWGIVWTSGGDLWLSENRGVIHIPSTEVRRVLSSPDYRPTYELLDSFDGLPGAFSAPGWAASKVIQATDGQLWFAASDGIARLDPANISRNLLPPPVSIRSVTADGKQYPSNANLTLPALTGNLQIGYSGLSLSVPERVYFRYKLEGSDKNWQDAGTRREAFYTNLRPGAYRFHVIARNDDGVWNEQGTILDFSVAPAWFQTIWFRVLCLAAATFMIWSIYHLRVQQVARTMSARFDERLAERTRLARELHDTFLQTIQGSKLVADDALERTDDPIQTRRALQKLSQWLARAMDEGRAALHSLRTSATEMNDLTSAFQRALEDCHGQASRQTAFSVRGDAREMHPLVRDEVYRIGYEAIRNACVHSTANRVDVVLSYATDLSLEVRDNGIGIDPVIAKAGKEGHFGLQGMRERASRIGARLTIASSANLGTEVRVVVPGRVVFRKPRVTPFEKFNAFVKSFVNK